MTHVPRLQHIAVQSCFADVLLKQRRAKMATISEMEELEVFNGFNAEQKKRLARIAHRVKYAKGQAVYLSRYRANRIFVVVKGRVDLRVLNTDGVVGVSFGTLDEGQLFGAASLFKPQEYTVTAYCQEDSELLVIEANDLLDLMVTDYELGYRFMKKVAQVYFDRYERTKTQIHNIVNTHTLVAATRE
jgi:CRP-like cAMP-binding protein